MLRSQPCIDDRRQGLAERQDCFSGPINAFTSTARLSGENGIADLSYPDPQALMRHLEIACRHGALIERVAAKHGTLPSIIAAFCSRRSGWGLNLTPAGVDGTRDFQARAVLADARSSPLPPDGLGFERGLMALDYDRHLLTRESRWCDPESNLDAAFALIATFLTMLRRRTTLQGDGLLRASLAAFEHGLDGVERAIRLGLDVDSAVPGRSCSVGGCGRDVLARAAFFQAEGWD